MLVVFHFRDNGKFVFPRSNVMNLTFICRQSLVSLLIFFIFVLLLVTINKQSLSLNQTKLTAVCKMMIKYRNAPFNILLYELLCLISCWSNSLSKLTQGNWKLIPSNLNWLLLNFIGINKPISIQYFKKISELSFRKYCFYSSLDILWFLFENLAQKSHKGL